MYDTPGGIDQEKARRQHVEAVGERRGLDFVAIDHVADRNNVAQAWHHQRKPPTHAVGEAAAFLTQWAKKRVRGRRSIGLWARAMAGGRNLSRQKNQWSRRRLAVLRQKLALIRQCCGRGRGSRGHDRAGVLGSVDASAQLLGPSAGPNAAVRWHWCT